MSRKGVDQHKAPDLCMVVGCHKKALYKNPSSSRQTHTARGYCSTHRDYAKARGSSFSEADAEYYAKSDKE